MGPAGGRSPCQSCQKQGSKEEAATTTLTCLRGATMQAEVLRISLQLQARCPNAVGKGQCQLLYFLQNLSVGSTSRPGRNRFGQGKHMSLGLRVSGQTGNLFPNGRKVGKNWHAAARPACSSNKVFWPLRKLPQSSLITRENNGKNFDVIEVKLT